MQHNTELILHMKNKVFCSPFHTPSHSFALPTCISILLKFTPTLLFPPPHFPWNVCSCIKITQLTCIDFYSLTNLWTAFSLSTSFLPTQILQLIFLNLLQASTNRDGLLLFLLSLFHPSPIQNTLYTHMLSLSYPHSPTTLPFTISHHVHC